MKTELSTSRNAVIDTLDDAIRHYQRVSGDCTVDITRYEDSIAKAVERRDAAHATLDELYVAKDLITRELRNAIEERKPGK